ncbi:hypothetical protein LEP3755_59110 [Leptolyngbya sp. NIES-3755]|nr:hypothetical protein LEP3755_59110 [Leptolyngbya sp. NIES-3755]
MIVMKQFSDRRKKAQQWYSATDLAGLPGLPTASHNVTRKAKLEGGNEYALSSLPAITRTALNESNGQGEIAQAALHHTTTVYPIAAAILRWGVPDHIRTDHGKEYLSRRVQRFLANLGVETEDLRCLPGHTTNPVCK